MHLSSDHDLIISFPYTNKSHIIFINNGCHREALYISPPLWAKLPFVPLLIKLINNKPVSLFESYEALGTDFLHHFLALVSVWVSLDLGQTVLLQLHGFRMRLQTRDDLWPERRTF